MGDTFDMDDNQLMRELEAAVRSGTAEAPESFVWAAEAAFIWRRVDEELELLTLSYDSCVADTVGVRGQASTAERILVFESEDVTMTLEVGQVLMGQVVPALFHTVALEDASGAVDESEPDPSGFFLLRRPASGPVRLTWRGEERSVVTEWLTI